MNERIVNKILIFAGTTEGRCLTEKLLAQGMCCHVCVATAYGRVVMDKHPNLTVHAGRLDQEGMIELMQSEDFSCVIDATHPFAIKVSESVRLSAEKAGLTYKRLARQTSCGDLPSDTVFVENVREAATYLNEQEGIIFLTTGSKELPVLTDIIQDKSRLIARVLPMHESLTICEECGLKPSQIIAMQGPFSEEMNVAMLRSTKAAYLLTKETGTIGGMQAKVSAAASLGVGLVMIRNPERNMTELYSEEEILAFLGL